MAAQAEDAPRVPAEIQLIVYSGLHITTPHPAAQVYLSMQCGSEKFSTAPKPKPSPVWDEECTFTIKHSHMGLPSKTPDTVLLTLKEKDGAAAGIVALPIAKLGAEKKGKHWATLESADGSPSPGRISFDCWITEYAKPKRHSLLDALSPRRHKKAGSDGGRMLGLQMQASSLGSGSVPDGLRRSADQLSMHVTSESSGDTVASWRAFSRRGDQDSQRSRDQDRISEKSRERDSERDRDRDRLRERDDGPAKDRDSKDRDLLSLPETRSNLSRSGSDASVNTSKTAPPASSPAPEVTGVSPAKGPASGGTVVTLRGSNLGKSLDDIEMLSVCGVDCTGTVSYFSPSMIKFVTRALPSKREVVGPITLTTASGGEGACGIQFSFHAPFAESAGQPPEVSGISPMYGPAGGGTSVRIFGSNLGKDREDLVGLTICGIDHLANVTSVSPRVIHCTTLSGHGSGAIVVITRSGGVGTAVVHYAYNKRLVMRSSSDDEEAEHDLEDAPPTAAVERDPCKMSKLQLEAEVKLMRQQLTKLQEVNNDQREYIDRLIGKLLDMDPSGSFFEHCAKKP